MAIKVYIPQKIINKLREAEILLNQGATIAMTLLLLEERYGGMRVDQAQHLKEVEQENSHLKRLVSDAFFIKGGEV